MKIIGFNDIKELNISAHDCYQWVSEMIVHKQNVFLPTKTHMSMPGNIFCNVMPCLINMVGQNQLGGGENCHSLSRAKPFFR